jgi:hypothetical protein
LRSIMIVAAPLNPFAGRCPAQQITYTPTVRRIYGGKPPDYSLRPVLCWLFFA